MEDLHHRPGLGLSAGRRVGASYRLERRIGAGGAGEVWRAFCERLQRPVAIKAIEAARLGEGALREAQVTAHLQHPAIVRVYEVLEESVDGHPLVLLVLELLDGESLADRVAAQGPLDAQLAAEIMVPVLDALDYAHAEGVVHRDIKPENLMWLHRAPYGPRLRLLDFGIALAAEDWRNVHRMQGTPDYMAPEQVDGSQVLLPAVDQWGAAVTIFHLVTGIVPFEASDHNLAEARLARLDRTTVIGRGFFDEVAPCTDTPEFRGRFERFAAGDGAAVQSFRYLFDFKFGAQQVRIEMVRFGGLGRFYLLVNRESFEAPRASAEAPAPRQDELRPVGEDFGALRDARGQRRVQAPTVLLDALMHTCQRIAPETWRVFCREWGVSWGRRTVLELELDSVERQGTALGDATMQEAAMRIHNELREQGWGALQVDFGPAKSGALRLTLDGSALASAARTEGKRCHLLAGMLTAYFTHLAGRRLHAEEIACTAEGAHQCEFALVDVERSDRLLDALRTAPDAATLWRALGVELS